MISGTKEAELPQTLYVSGSQAQYALQCPFLMLYFLSCVFQLAPTLPAHQVSKVGLFSPPLISLRFPLSQLL